MDPRTEVTPDAFEISPEILGLPLARPWSRLAALAVDGILIVLVSRAGFLLLGMAAAVFFLRMAISRERGDYLAKAFRGVLGCLGFGILFVTGCSVFALFGPDGDAGDQLDPELGLMQEGSGDEISADLGDVFSGISEVRAYRRAQTVDEARERAIRVARRLGDAGAPAADISDALRELAPGDAPWYDQLDSVVGQAVSAPGNGSADRSPESLPDSSDEMANGAEEIDGEPVDSVDAARREARLAEVAGDTLAVLRARLEEESQDRVSLERRLERTRQELEEVRNAGFLDRLGRLIDDLGLAFGWGAIYLTVFLTWWNGQTPGKRLLGIRVRQLDGTPLSWWESFERAGGYAAGFATGLLGFAQVVWDPNRQAIHDKIAETVVVSERN